VNVTSPAAVVPPSPTIPWFQWYHKDASGTWIDNGQKQLAATATPGTSLNLISLNPAIDALQAASLQPSSCTSSPSLCWVNFWDFDDAVNPDDPWIQGGRIGTYGGSNTYPYRIVWRYNGVVVKDAIMNDPWGGAIYAPRVKMIGAQEGDMIVITVTGTDAAGTTILQSILKGVAYPPDPGMIRARRGADAGTSAAKPKRDPKILGSSKPDLSTVGPSNDEKNHKGKP
jgi:hypothetical protein